MYIDVCIYACVRVSGLLELELQVVRSFLLLVLGIKFAFSAGAVFAFSCCAIFPAPNNRDLISAEECEHAQPENCPRVCSLEQDSYSRNKYCWGCGVGVEYLSSTCESPARCAREVVFWIKLTFSVQLILLLYHRQALFFF